MPVDDNVARSFFLRESAAVFGIRCAFMGLELAIAVTLAQILGVSQFGIYAFAYALMRVLAMPAQAGIPTLAVREMSKYFATSRWSLAKGFIIRSNQAISGLALLLAASAIGLFQWGGDFAASLDPTTYAWSLVLLPLVALGNLRGSMLRGLRKPVIGLLPENVVRPGLFLLLVALLLPNLPSTASSAMMLHVVAGLLAFGVGAVALHGVLSSRLNRVEPTFQTAEWARAVLPMSAISGLQIVNMQVAIIALGAGASPEEVGIFRAASQVALVVGFAITVASLVVAPVAASAFAEGDQIALRRIAHLAAGLTSLVGLVAGTLLILGRGVLLSFFGQEFATQGSLPLLILCCGYMTASLVGVPLVLLNMTGNERAALICVAVATLTNVVGCLVLIPAFGLPGAAVAVAVSTGCAACTASFLLWTKLRISSLPFGLHKYIRRNHGR